MGNMAVNTNAAIAINTINGYNSNADNGSAAITNVDAATPTNSLNANAS